MPATRHERPVHAPNGTQLKQWMREAFEQLLNRMYKNHLVYPGVQATITLDSQVVMAQPPTHHGEQMVVVEAQDGGGREGTLLSTHAAERGQAHIGGGAANAPTAPSATIENPPQTSRAHTGDAIAMGEVAKTLEPRLGGIPTNVDTPFPALPMQQPGTGGVPMSPGGQLMSAGRHDPSKRARSLDQKTVEAKLGSVGDVPAEAREVKDELATGVPESTRPEGAK